MHYRYATLSCLIATQQSFFFYLLCAVMLWPFTSSSRAYFQCYNGECQACGQTSTYKTIFLSQANGVACIETYKHNGWRKANGRPLANVDLWRAIALNLSLCPHVHVKHASADTPVHVDDADDRQRLRELILHTY